MVARKHGALYRIVAIAIVAVVAAVVVVRATGSTLPALHRGAAPVIIEPLGPRTIASENELPGSTEWRIDRPSLAGEIQAYAGQVSVQRGETLDVYASTQGGAPFDAEVYRMGWYGGAGARKLESFRDIASLDQGRWLPATGLRDCASCRVDPATMLIEAGWTRSFQVTIRSDWTSGYYLIKLRELHSDTSTYVPFIVRDDRSAAPILVQASVNTWQAYNSWGDASLYGSFDGNRHWTGKARRAYRVSFDRPYDPALNNSGNDGAGLFFSWEYDFVRWAESRGYEMTYTTNVDVSQHPESLSRRRLFISLGHDEYWTGRERDAVEAARDAGVNIAFFGGNEAYWQGRLEASGDGTPARVLTVYKDASLDPLAASDPADATVLFSDAPVKRGESMLTGTAYGSNATPAYQAWQAGDVSGWTFEGTGIKAGDRFPGIVGYEYDAMAPDGQRPGGLAVLGRSPVHGFKGDDISVSTLYSARSGALVFDAGTIAWSWGLDDYGHEQQGRFADDRLRRFAANLVERMSAPMPAPAATQPP